MLQTGMPEEAAGPVTVLGSSNSLKGHNAPCLTQAALHPAQQHSALPVSTCLIWLGAG